MWLSFHLSYRFEIFQLKCWGQRLEHGLNVCVFCFFLIPSWSWMVKHSPCLCKLSFVSNAFYSDPLDALEAELTCSKQSIVPTAQKSASVPSSQLSSLGAFFCFRTSRVCHFLMDVCSFRNLSLSLCDLKMSHSPSLYKKRCHKTSLLPLSKKGPWPQSCVQITSGFQQMVSKVHNGFRGTLGTPLG